MEKENVLPQSAHVALDPQKDLQAVEELHKIYQQIHTELHKRIVGQDHVIESLLVALFSRGHTLLVGVPGLAKTLLIATLAEILDLAFNRIQFTPDLMPSDITGTDILEEDHATGKRVFRFVHGPIFCNLLLADEINRTPPKTQAALLQSMQEYRVTAGGSTYPLDLPFLVMATQNPIEQEGTYPLPEAQLDRFMLQIRIGYPTALEEEEIVRSTTSNYKPDVKKLLDAEKIRSLQELVRRVPVPDHAVRAAVKLVRSTRPDAEESHPIAKQYLTWGAGPRASQNLILGAKARAILQGRYSVEVEDVHALAKEVLSHRILTNYEAESENIRPEDIIDTLLKAQK
ncbi:MAG: MoxR family ATPase [Myxococcales bacterium]|nr:MoxR family ATPase [Myxococcales bacterium]MCB9644590.1 MoxR family ATPase [Myxococcales bacterium]